MNKLHLIRLEFAQYGQKTLTEYEILGQVCMADHIRELITD